MKLRVDVAEKNVVLFRRLLSVKNISWTPHIQDPEATILENVTHFTLFSFYLTVYANSWHVMIKIQRDMVVGLAPA
jgi:hypothetical protein